MTDTLHHLNITDSRVDVAMQRNTLKMCLYASDCLGDFPDDWVNNLATSRHEVTLKIHFTIDSIIDYFIEMHDRSFGDLNGLDPDAAKYLLALSSDLRKALRRIEDIQFDIYEEIEND
jgi:hypothetical protein